jgi:hypothetical protein
MALHDMSGQFLGKRFSDIKTKYLEKISTQFSNLTFHVATLSVKITLCCCNQRENIQSNAKKKRTRSFRLLGPVFQFFHFGWQLTTTVFLIA